jgi:hypothetical protein
MGLRELAREKATAIGLPPKNFYISESWGPRHSVTINVMDGAVAKGVGVLITDQALVDQGLLEAKFEHAACIARLYYEGWVDDTLACIMIGGEEDDLVDAVQRSLHDGYISHAAATDQLITFGQPSYDHWLAADLPLQRARLQAFQHEPERNQRLYLLSTLAVWQVLNSLMSHDPGVLPIIIRTIVAPFPEAYEHIREVRAPWEQKRTLLGVMTAYTLGRLDPLASVDQDALVFTSEESVLDDLRTIDYLNADMYQAAKPVEEALRRTYHSTREKKGLC